jgi:hypothetical protein
MKHQNYTQNGLDGPYKPTKPTKADTTLFWLSGFVMGFITALLATGN